MNQTQNNYIQVAVGVVVNNQQVFITQRHLAAHQGGKWEFPGGKVEANESVYQALARELKEEIGIEVLACQPLCNIQHDYGDKQVQLSVFIVEQYLNEPQAQEGQAQRWVAINQLARLDFPKANEAIITALTEWHSQR